MYKRITVVCFGAQQYFMNRQMNGGSTDNTGIYRVIQNDCRGFNNLSYTIHLREKYMFFLFNRTTLQVFVTYPTGALYVNPL